MRPHLLVLAAAALVAGCGADSSVSPSNAPVSLDEVFKEMSLPAISGAASAAGGLDASALSAGASIPTGCSYALATQSFVCAPISAGGFTVKQSYQLLDASGSPLSLFDAKSLSGVRMQGSIAGTDTSAGDTFTILGTQDQTLSGLQTSKHTLNGIATTLVTGRFATDSAGAPPFTINMTSTTKDLVIPAHPAANTYPASGTITIDETTSVSGRFGSFTTRIVLTFNGTSKVKMTIDGVSVPGCSTIDLSSANPGCS